MNSENLESKYFSKISPKIQAHQQEQLELAMEAAQINPRLTGSKPAINLSLTQKNEINSKIIPLLFQGI